MKHQTASNELQIAQTLLSEKRLQEAATILRKLLELNPYNGEAMNVLGDVLISNDEIPTAIKHFIYAAKIYIHLDQYEHASGMFKKAYDLDQNSQECIVEYASHLLQFQKFTQALELTNRAIANKPNFAIAYLQRSFAMENLEDLEAAKADASRCISLEPELCMAYIQLASLHIRLHELDLAKEIIATALKLDPNFDKARLLQAELAWHIGDAQTAQNQLRKLLIDKPDHALAHLRMAHIQLSKGHMAQGWKEYEWRHQALNGEAYDRHPLNHDDVLPRPSTYKQDQYPNSQRWQVRSDEGLGEELLFLRYAPALDKKNVQITYLPSEKLLPMLQRNRVPVEISAEAHHGFDQYLLAGELPLLADLHDVPASLSLQTDPQRQQILRRRLEGIGPPPYVGLTWNAGTKKVGRTHRSIDVAKLGAALNGIEATFINVQRLSDKGTSSQLEQSLGKRMYDFSDVNTDLEDALAMMDLLDEYIGVGNTNMHLRTCLGKGSHVLVTNPPEWHWGWSSNETPWFPGSCLYRQSATYCWTNALQQLRKNIQRLIVIP